jgi:hypothetical protein
MTPSDGRQILLEVDSRRRISLGSLAKHDRYLVEVSEDGVIVLTPAIVMPATEAAARMDEFLDHPESGIRWSGPERKHTEKEEKD